MELAALVATALPAMTLNVNHSFTVIDAERACSVSNRSTVSTPIA